MQLHRGYPTPAGSFWHVYTEYPELYDRFALSTVEAAKKVHELVDFRDARVLDVASGTGKNAFEHAKIARAVIGIDPMAAMREFAAARARALDVRNVEFRDGIAEDLSMFGDDSFDVAISMFGAPFPWDMDDRFVRGCERVVRSGGHVIVVGTPPSWRPSFARSRAVPFGNPAVQQATDDRLAQLGFAAHDFVVDLDYGTEQEALETFGFVYGPTAIDHILDNKTSHQEWALRVYAKRV